MEAPFRRWRLWGLLAGLGVTGFLVFFAGRSGSRPEQASSRREVVVQSPTSFPLVPYTPTRFKNVSDDATDVGSKTCAECHQTEYDSYKLTAHATAFSPVVPTHEPKDATYAHTPSGRSYKVYRSDGRLRHRESLLDDKHLEIASADHAVSYLVGSGRHSRTYLIERDGFLTESPVTWYQSTKSWTMSPGFDRPVHDGFERAIDFGCLVCHVGNVEIDDFNRMRFHEYAIGCENCHGHGSLHVKLQQRLAKDPREEVLEEDTTIVTPSALSRELSEAICAECHLRGAAGVALRGRDVDSFRPGLPLTDVRIDFFVTREDDIMNVTGHVDQMHRSACYQGSETLTCITCHDPHLAEVTDTSTHYRDTCLSCHASESCGLTTETRLQQSVTDNCVECHMPQSQTDIPHIAFTHHRIGIHGNEPKSHTINGVGRLEPFGDVSHLPTLELKRALGLGYYEAAQNQETAHAFHAFRERAEHLLDDVVEQGLRDGAVFAALAQLNWSRHPSKAIVYAQAALEDPRILPDARGTSLLVLGDSLLKSNRPSEALIYVEQLVQRRSHSEDYFLLARCLLQTNQFVRAQQALEKTLQLNPFHAAADIELATLAAMAGKHVEAEEHRKRTVRLRGHSARD